MVDNVKIEVSIPKKIYDAAIKKAKEAGFANINEFLVFVLEQLVEEEDLGQNVFTKEEEEAIKDRLRALGYIE